jgi:uncharacterized Zn-finger protein
MDNLIDYKPINIPRHFTENVLTCKACKTRFILTGVTKQDTPLSEAIGEPPVYVRMTQISAYYCPYCGEKERGG